MSRTLPFKTFHIRCRGVSRTDATSKMELFVTLVNSFKSLTNVAKTSVLDVAGVLVALLSGSFYVLLAVFVNPLLSL